LVETLDKQILIFETELEIQYARQRELKQARDLAWENYTTVQRKVAEVQLDSQITDSQVRIAARAITPRGSVSPKPLRNTAIAGALGLMLAVFGVFALEYWRSGELTPKESPSKSASD
jgi:uncharacterized protein involved in exopolysaccharide biosynthesis